MTVLTYTCMPRLRLHLHCHGFADSGGITSPSVSFPHLAEIHNFNSCACSTLHGVGVGVGVGVGAHANTVLKISAVCHRAEAFNIAYDIVQSNKYLGFGIT